MSKLDGEPSGKVTLSLGMMLLAALAADGIVRLVIQLYLRGLQAPPLIVSLSTTLFWLGILVGSSVWGTLSDRYPIRGLLLGALGICTLTTGVIALQLPPFGTLVTVLVRALAFGGLVPISMAATSKASSSDNRGRNLSRAVSFRPLGNTLGALTAGFLLQSIGFSGALMVSGVLFVMALPVVLSLPRKRGQVSGVGRHSVACLREHGLRALYAAAFLGQAAVMGSLSLVYVHMAALRVPVGSMGVVSALGPAVAIPGLLLLGSVTDRVKRRVVFSIGFAMMAAVPAVFSLARGITGMAAGYLVFGLSFSSMYLGTTAHIGDVVPRERQGQMLGLFESSRALGGVLGPLVAGTIATPLGFRGMFLVLAGIGTVGFLLALLVGRRASLPSQP